MNNKPDLLGFQRPGRYLGKEWNSNYNLPDRKDFRICLCYPHYYETGMSNIGFLLVYHLLNNIEGVNCERCFLPRSDMQAYLINNNKPLFSLETGTALKDFDLVGFSVNYELNLINFLTMLKLGHIAVKACDRDAPLVIIGGLPNPEPIADFVDICFLGEFEERAYSIMNILKKTKGLPKDEKLIALSDTEGIYIPVFYSLQGYSLKPKNKNAVYPLKRTFVNDLNKSFSPQTWPVPFIPVIFDRVQLEVQRGCPNKCKFCQARCIYRPYRQKKPDLVIKEVIRLAEQTGYETVSLLGLSVIDYSHLSDILDELIPHLKKKRIGLSIPSVRPKSGAAKILEKLHYTKKPGLTLALESASAQLRRKIGKDVDLNDCKELVKCAASLGYKRLKFYFMIGLPGETEQDVLKIGDILEMLSLLFKDIKGHVPQINATISCFLPKPFTDFENHTIDTKPVFLKKKMLLKDRLSRNRNIKLNFSWYEQSLLENILSRADRRISPVIEKVLLKTLAYPEKASELSTWHNISREEGLDLNLFTQTSQTIPTHIDG